jgi:hypothetical protein
MTRICVLALLLAVTVPAAAQSETGFERANARAEAQWAAQEAATAKYADTWAAFNNAQHLDERDGCYFKAEGELTQVVELDGSGKVVGYYTDHENGRSQCWRATYTGVTFPKPPFAPYWHKLVMH